SAPLASRVRDRFRPRGRPCCQCESTSTGAKRQVARPAVAKTTASAAHAMSIVAPPIGAAKGKMRTPAKTWIASSAENRIAPASITNPTTTSARAEAVATLACAAMASAAHACRRRNRELLSTSSPPFSWTPAAASATPAAPIKAATLARTRGERFIPGSAGLNALDGSIGMSQSRPLGARLSRRVAMPDFRVRAIERSDRAQWEPLWRAYLDFYRAQWSDEVAEATFARIFDPLEPVHALVAERGGELVGFTHYLFQRSTWLINSQIYLQDLYVGEAARGGGVGRALIAAVVDAAK